MGKCSFAVNLPLAVWANNNDGILVPNDITSAESYVRRNGIREWDSLSNQEFVKKAQDDFLAKQRLWSDEEQRVHTTIDRYSSQLGTLSQGILVLKHVPLLNQSSREDYGDCVVTIEEKNIDILLAQQTNREATTTNVLSESVAPDLVAADASPVAPSRTSDLISQNELEITGTFTQRLESVETQKTETIQLIKAAAWTKNYAPVVQLADQALGTLAENFPQLATIALSELQRLEITVVDHELFQMKLDISVLTPEERELLENQLDRQRIALGVSANEIRVEQNNSKSFLIIEITPLTAAEIVPSEQNNGEKAKLTNEQIDKLTHQFTNLWIKFKQISENNKYLLIPYNELVQDAQTVQSILETLSTENYNFQFQHSGGAVVERKAADLHDSLIPFFTALNENNLTKIQEILLNKQAMGNLSGSVQSFVEVIGTRIAKELTVSTSLLTAINYSDLEKVVKRIDPHMDLKQVHMADGQVVTFEGILEIVDIIQQEAQKTASTVTTVDASFLPSIQGLIVVMPEPVKSILLEAARQVEAKNRKLYFETLWTQELMDAKDLPTALTYIEKMMRKDIYKIKIEDDPIELQILARVYGQVNIIANKQDALRIIKEYPNILSMFFPSMREGVKKKINSYFSWLEGRKKLK